MGPQVGGEINGWVSLASGIEEETHDVIHWCVLGHSMPGPTGIDGSSPQIAVADSAFSNKFSAITSAGIQILDIDARSKRSLDIHRNVNRSRRTRKSRRPSKVPVGTSRNPRARILRPQVLTI
jgi:hypothetical protein